MRSTRDIMTKVIKMENIIIIFKKKHVNHFIKVALNRCYLEHFDQLI
jgi:hypothetical protein